MNRTFLFSSIFLMILVVGCQSVEGKVKDLTSPTRTIAPSITPLPTGTLTPVSEREEETIDFVKDVDGYVYPVLKIGDQYWMGANLRTVTNAEGNEILSFCYDDLEENCNIYGRLYRWKEAMAGSLTEGAQGICPDGWHIPSDDEWMVLINFLGGEVVAGGQLKAADYWNTPNAGGTDEVSFGALPTGWFDFMGDFYGLGEICFLRTSTSDGPYEILVREISSQSASITSGGLHPDDAIPIRCVMDQP